MDEGIDALTGRSRKVILEFKEADLKPRIVLKAEEASMRFFLPIDANILVQEDDEIQSGDVLAKIPRETTKTKDITGGLPGLPLFEAGSPKRSR